MSATNEQAGGNLREWTQAEMDAADLIILALIKDLYERPEPGTAPPPLLEEFRRVLQSGGDFEELLERAPSLLRRCDA